MKQIALSQGQVALVDDENYEWLNSFKWWALWDGRNFYAGRNIRVNGKRRTQKMHQLIMGVNPLKLDIDHRDGNGCNNQKANLRFCTRQENQRNRKPSKNCSSVYKGVYRGKGKRNWRAYIKIDKKMVHLGCFNVETDAAMAYNAAAIKHHGEFALLNIIK